MCRSGASLPSTVRRVFRIGDIVIVGVIATDIVSAATTIGSTVFLLSLLYVKVVGRQTNVFSIHS